MGKRHSPIKIPFYVRLGLFFGKYKPWLVTALLVFILGLLIWFIVSNGQVQAAFNNPSVSGVFGAFVGAIGAGLFSFYVLRSQFKAQAAINRKKNIYIPLYNDLLKKKMELQSLYTKKIFTAYDSFLGSGFIWDSFKKDDRYLEVPSYVAEILNDLEKVYKDYNHNLNVAGDLIRNTINSKLLQLNAVIVNEHIGTDMLAEGFADKDFFDKRVFQFLMHKDDVEKYKYSRQYDNTYERFHPTRIELSESDKTEIRNYLQDSIPKLAEVIEVISYCEYTLDCMDKAVELLKNIILRITHKYEIQKGIF
jgi:hypothetical protein